MNNREALYRAAISCRHEITKDQIILYVDEKKEGNALSQLADRLDQAALASQEPTLKNNEFIPDSTEGRIQAAIKCLNMHWVSHDANRFDYAIEGLEKCLAGLASQAQQPTDLSKQLREYAADSGYSHNDYADTMLAAASEIERCAAILTTSQAQQPNKEKILVDAITEVLRVLETDNEAILDTVWTTRGDNETLWEHCAHVLEQVTGIEYKPAEQLALDLQSQAQQEPAKAKHHPICDRRYPSLCDACNAEAQAKRIAELEDRLSSFPIPTSVAMQKIGKLRSEGFKEYAATVLNKKNQYCIVGDYGDVRWLSKNGE